MMKKLTLAFVALVAALTLATTALAQANVGSGVVNGVSGATNSAPSPTSGVQPVPTLPNNPIALDQLFVTIIKDIFIALALTAFIALIWAGMMYITAGGDAAKAEKARKSILYTLIGVVVALLSYAIVGWVTKVASTAGTTSNSGTSASSQAGNGNTKATNPKIGTQNPDGSYYNPCVSETPQGCVDSDGLLTGYRSDGTLVTSADTTAPTAPADAKYGLSIADPDNTASRDTVTITNRAESFNHPYGVTLNNQPTGTVTVRASIAGSLALRLSDTTLIFSADNYSEPQGVNIQYLGGGKPGQSATVTFTGSDGSTLEIKFVIP
ncbi:MAG TPA: pilin [Candidatus Saccharimonadales bacterium]|nr:pilin [Candidatus Saccharimonadales bacterium]